MSSTTAPVATKFVVLVSVDVFNIPVAVLRSLSSVSLLVIKPETVATSVVNV